MKLQDTKKNMKNKKSELLRRLKIVNTPNMVHPPKNLKYKTRGLIQYTLSGLTFVRLDEVIKLVKETL